MNQEFHEYFQTKKKELMVTIFNETTYKENILFREQNNIPCIYSCNYPITSVEMKKGIYVLECDITNNKIRGIGFIVNKEAYYKKIYDDERYNNYAYRGKYHISREEMSDEEEIVISALEYLCFYGKTHVKRYSGIKRFPRQWIYNMREKVDVLEFITKMFHKRLHE
jgi:hypothetical protein